MSWTDIFPVFTEERVDEFEELATPEERAELEAWYGIEEIFNAQPECREVVSFSLFWKNVRASDPDLPLPSRESMESALENGVALRFRPWDHYVQPFLDHVPFLKGENPGTAFRVYLAKDLEFLVPDLLNAGCEVCLMKSSSLRFAPGGLWRFLPFEEEGKLITVADVDRLNQLEGDLARTRTMEQAGVAAWRVPVPTDLTGDHEVCYLPFMGCQFGVQGGHMEVRRLLDAFTWQARRGGVDHMVMFPNCGPLPIQAHTWPTYGFDEFFMTVAAYPRLAQGGMLTFVPSTARSQLLSIDVEYVTWGNPQSELVYFAAGSCCGVAPQGDERLGGEMDGPAEVGRGTFVEFPPGGAPEIAPPPIMGFLFLTRGELHHPEIWKTYLGENSCRIFAHVKDPETLGKLSLLKEHLVSTHVDTRWGHISVVNATLAMLRDALQESDCTHFVLASESCVPVRPLVDLGHALELDPRSRVQATPWAKLRQTDLLRAQRGENLPGISKELVHFHSQWVLLSRSDAAAVLDVDRTEAFGRAHCPDEFYFGTMLALAGTPPLQATANRNVTWTDWNGQAAHPRKFDQVSPRDVARIAESGCFFARKFAEGSNIGDYGLHAPGPRETRMEA